MEVQNKKYMILTMGCKLNENDSEKIAGMLEELGYSKTEVAEESDVFVINTCCVRENAEEKVFGKLGELKKNKRKSRNHYCNRWMHDAGRYYERKNS